MEKSTTPKVHDSWHWQQFDHVLAFTQTSTEVMQHLDAI